MPLISKYIKIQNNVSSEELTVTLLKLLANSSSPYVRAEVNNRLSFKQVRYYYTDKQNISAISDISADVIAMALFYSVPDTILSDAKLRTAGRRITKLLRHTALQCGLPIYTNGYISVNEVLTYIKGHVYEVSFIELLLIIYTDIKQRVSLIVGTEAFHNMATDTSFYIRATQGHSIQSLDLQYDKVSISQYLHKDDNTLQNEDSVNRQLILYHITTNSTFRSIVIEGFDRCKRKYLHLARDRAEQPLIRKVKVAMDHNTLTRKGLLCSALSAIDSSTRVIIYINTYKLLSRYDVYRSENNVYLCANRPEISKYIHPDCILAAFDMSTQEQLY